MGVVRESNGPGRVCSIFTDSTAPALLVSMDTRPEDSCACGLYPLAYLLTFTCYGTRLHGDPRLSVDRYHNQSNGPFAAPNPSLLAAEEKRLKFPPYSLDPKRRRIVGDSLRWISEKHNWDLISFHVRAKHVHLVLAAGRDPERILTELKRAASRELNLTGLGQRRSRRWTRGGSKRYLWTPESVASAVGYVLNHQGEAMEIYLADAKWLFKSR